MAAFVGCFFSPRDLYGIALSADVENKYSPVLFVLASTALYIGCFLFLQIGKFDDFFVPRLYLASATGSLMLFLAYYLIISHDFTFWRTLLYSLLTGIVSAIPASLFCYYIYAGERNNIFFIGIFSIYPIWQIAFSILINTCQITSSTGDQSNLDEHNNADAF